MQTADRRLSQSAHGLFYFHDSHGIPPDIALRYLHASPALTSRLLFSYIVDALHAGWSAAKLRGELRDLHYLGITVPQ